MAAVLPVGIYHRVRSKASREKLDRRQEGLFILLTLRPITLAGMGGLLTFVASPRADGLVVGAAAGVAPLGRGGDRDRGRRPADLDFAKPGHQHHRHGRHPDDGTR